MGQKLMQPGQMVLDLLGGFLGIACLEVPKETAAGFYKARLGRSTRHPSKKTQKYVRERVDQHRQDFVARSEGEQAIEFGDIANSILVTPQAGHLRRIVYVLFDRLNVRIRSSLARQPNDSRLYQQAGLGEVIERD